MPTAFAVGIFAFLKYYPSAIYKNSIAFCAGLSCCFTSFSVKFASQTFRRLPLRVCAIFVILVVGATIGRPWAFYERPWTVGDAGPYKICGIFDILPVGATSGRPSFIKISFCLKRTVNLQSKYGRTVPTIKKDNTTQRL